MAEENKAVELHGEESEKKKYISDVLDIDKLILSQRQSEKYWIRELERLKKLLS